MDHVGALWDHAFFDRLRINPREHPILLAEPTANTKELREAAVSLMFEVRCLMLGVVMINTTIHRSLVSRPCTWLRTRCSTALQRARALASASTAHMKAVLVRGVGLACCIMVLGELWCFHRDVLHRGVFTLVWRDSVLYTARCCALDEQLVNCNLELLNLCLELAALVGGHRACNHLLVCACVCMHMCLCHAPDETRRMPCQGLPWRG